MGLRRSRCDCSGGLTFGNGDFSPLKQPTRQICVARVGHVEHAMSKWTTSEILLKKSVHEVPNTFINLVFSNFSVDKACLVIHFSSNQIQLELYFV